MKVPVQRYYIGRYVTVSWFEEQDHTSNPFIEEGYLHRRKIEVGKELIIEPVRKAGIKQEPISLGIVIQGCKYKKKEQVKVLAGGVWYTIEYNRSLHNICEDHIGWLELLDEV